MPRNRELVQFISLYYLSQSNLFITSIFSVIPNSGALKISILRLTLILLFKVTIHYSVIMSIIYIVSL